MKEKIKNGADFVTRNIKKIFPKKSIWLWVGFLLLVALGVFGKMYPSLAQSISRDQVASGIVTFFSRSTFAIAELCIQAAVFALEFFIDLARYNDFVNPNNAVVTLGWLMVRDVANMFFVVVLLMIAVGTILGLEQYEWKKTLIKFVIAALLVNFSKMIFGLIIDVAHIFTITFVNAMAAAAGGNLISMFKMTKMFEMIKTIPAGKQGGDFDYQLFGASLMALFMAITAMITIGAYTIVLMARVVVLWALIIISPLAFILQVIPQTQSYAQKIWDKFIKHVLVAPIMVFFLWLSFATLGAGDVAMQMNLQIAQSDIEGFTANKSVKQTLSISDATTWENLSSYMIAIAFLMVGIGAVGEMGVVGGGLVSKGIDFAKNAVTIASGYALGRKMVGGAIDGTISGAKKVGKGALWHAPVVGGEKWAMRGKNEWAAVRKWYRNKAAGISPDVIRAEKEKNDEEQKLGVTDAGERLGVRKNIETLQAEKNKVEKDLETEQDDGKKADLTARQAQIDEEIKTQQKSLGEQDVGKRAQIEANVKKKQEEIEILSEKAKSGPMAAASRSSLKLEKRLKKTEAEAESVKNLALKRTSSEAGGIFVQRRVGMFTGDPITIDAQDRIIRGMFKAEDMRSKSKDEEFEGLGRQMVLSSPRFKNGEFQKGDPTMMEQITSHKFAAHHYENAMKKLENEANLKIVASFNLKEGMHKLNDEISALKMKDKMADMKSSGMSPQEKAKIKAQMKAKEAELAEMQKQQTGEWKSMSGLSYDDFLQTQALSQITGDTYKTMEEEHSKQRLGDIYGESLTTDKLSGEWESGMYNLDPAVVDSIKENKKKKEEAEKALAKLRGEKNDLFMESQRAEEDLKIVNAGGTGGLLEKIDAKITGLATGQEEREAELAAIVVTDEEERLAAVIIPRKGEETAVKNAKLKVAKRDELQEQITNIKESIKSQNIKKREIEGLSAQGADIGGFLSQKVASSKQEMSAKDAVIKEQEAVRTQLQAELIEKEGVMHIEAKIIRKGDDVAQAFLQKKMAELQTKIDTEEDQGQKKKYESQMQSMKGAVSSMQAGSGYAWQYGAAKGKSADVARHHQYHHNELLTVAAQREVYDKRGISTPSTALTEMVEQFEKDFREMGYDQYVESVGNMMGAYMEKRKNGEEISAADRAAMMGLYRRGFKESWVDDAVIGIMQNSGTNADIGRALGWRDNSFSPDKIGDVTNLFQSAGDVDFAKQAVVIREVLDEGLSAVAEDMKMSVEGVFEGMRTGIFKNIKGDKLGDEQMIDFRNKINEHLKGINRDLTQEQKKLLDDLLDGGKGEGALDKYLAVAGENQASFQYMGNLRNEAIANGHVENSGHSLFKDIGGGKSMYIASGVRMARNHGYGDFNKLEARKRMASHPHVGFNLNGDTQVGVGCREDDFGVMTKNVDFRSMSAATSRLVNVATGIGATESSSDYQQNGTYSPMRSEETQKAHEEAHSYDFETFKARTGFAQKAKDPVQKKKLRSAFAARSYVQNMLLPQMRTNMPVALMLQAANTVGVQALGAANNGDMNLTLPYVDKEGNVQEKQYKKVNDFLVDVDKGVFGALRGSLPIFTAANLTEADLAAQANQVDGEPS
ncbi:MAG TPA: hypothetical protein DEB09_01885 [Candidatus Magasanikbacteria bacterium]|nr:hypothetical protein [Candidatus Magasanikbacteria bacterium]